MSRVIARKLWGWLPNLTPFAVGLCHKQGHQKGHFSCLLPRFSFLPWSLPPICFSPHMSWVDEERRSTSISAVRCCSDLQVASLEPATHAYSFWEGVPASGKEAFGKLFAKSRSLKVRRRGSAAAGSRCCRCGISSSH